MMKKAIIILLIVHYAAGYIWLGGGTILFSLVKMMHFPNGILVLILSLIVELLVLYAVHIGIRFFVIFFAVIKGFIGVWLLVTLLIAFDKFNTSQTQLLLLFSLTSMLIPFSFWRWNKGIGN